MDRKRFREDATGLGPVKVEAAAFAVGAPFYGVAVVLLTGGAGRLAMLALYGIAAGGWIAWRAGRARGAALRGRAG